MYVCISTAPGTASRGPTSVPKKDPPIAKPPPPATVTSGGTTQVGGQPAGMVDVLQAISDVLGITGCTWTYRSTVYTN